MPAPLGGLGWALRAVDHSLVKQAVERAAQPGLRLCVVVRLSLLQSNRGFHEAVIDERQAHLDGVGHAQAISLRDPVLGQVGRADELHDP